MGLIEQIGRSHDLFVVEDAAQAHGGRYRARRCGGFGHATGFSFYPTKNLGAMGDGGAVTTSDADLADRVRLLRNYGSRSKGTNEVVGCNSRLDELQAAFLRGDCPGLMPGIGGGRQTLMPISRSCRRPASESVCPQWLTKPRPSGTCSSSATTNATGSRNICPPSGLRPSCTTPSHRTGQGHTLTSGSMMTACRLANRLAREGAEPASWTPPDTGGPTACAVGPRPGHLSTRPLSPTGLTRGAKRYV